jgi:hypothetical protein
VKSSEQPRRLDIDPTTLFLPHHAAGEGALRETRCIERDLVGLRGKHGSLRERVADNLMLARDARARSANGPAQPARGETGSLRANARLLPRPGTSRSSHTRSPSNVSCRFFPCRPNAEFSSGRLPTSEEDAWATLLSPASQSAESHAPICCNDSLACRASPVADRELALHSTIRKEGTASTSARRTCSSPGESIPERLTAVQPHLRSGPHTPHMEATGLELAGRAPRR